MRVKAAAGGTLICCLKTLRKDPLRVAWIDNRHDEEFVSTDGNCCTWPAFTLGRWVRLGECEHVGSEDGRSTLSLTDDGAEHEIELNPIYSSTHA